MTNPKNMQHDISYHLDGDRFILYLDITNRSGEERRFYFSNETGSLARNGIRLFDAEDNEMKIYGREFMSPAYNAEKVSENILAPNERQRFEFPARIFEEDGEWVLSFRGILFKIPRNKKFYITFEFSQITSNKLEVII